MVVLETVAIYQYPDEPDELEDPDELDDPELDELVVVVVVVVVDVLPPVVADTTSAVVVELVIMLPLALMLPWDILGIISTLSTVAPLMNISSELDSI